MKTKTTTIRVPKETLKQIDELCEKTGKCRNSWINAAAEFALNYSSDYDFGNDPEEEIEESKEIPKAEITLIPDEDKFKSYYDENGNYFTYDHGTKTWTVHLDAKNVTVVP